MGRALYVHIPFCLRKCAYCDFVSYAGREDAMEAYLCALEREMAASARRFGSFSADSVYLGGGTPTLLPGAALARLMDALRACFSLAPEAEISMEGNPGTLTRENLRAYRVAGVNRLSLGVQSLDDTLLRALGRIHTRRQALEAVEMARDAGFDNLNLDLMYALPGQRVETWLETLEEALALAPEHLSLYSLIVEEGTPLARQVAAGQAILPEDDTVLFMQHEAARRLSRRGYARYEISNYAKPGRECRHNEVYWTRGDYLGLGCAAHSFVEGIRFANPDSLAEYLAAPDAERSGARVSGEEAREEALMLSLRMAQGIDLAEFARRYGVDLLAWRAPAVRWLAENGFVRIETGRLFLTEVGMDVQNAVVLRLVTG